MGREIGGASCWSGLASGASFTSGPESGGQASREYKKVGGKGNLASKHVDKLMN